MSDYCLQLFVSVDGKTLITHNMSSTLLSLVLAMLVIPPSSSTMVPLCQFTVETFVAILSTDESMRQQVSSLVPSGQAPADLYLDLVHSLVTTRFNPFFC